VFAVHVSVPAQLPASVKHPLPELQFAVQHTFDGPTAHVVVAAVQLHVSQPPAPSQ